MSKNPPYIVCAANKCKDNVILGARHWDDTMRKHHVTFINAGFSEGEKWTNWEQGFIDQYGKWYNRTEALKVVKESRQPFNEDRNGVDYMLFSEGLY